MMVKFLLRFAKQQLERLKKLASDTELPVSEHVRRAVDEYLQRQGY